jgi:hypothetical protein
MAKKIKRVYVAGAITPKGTNSTNPAIDYLVNVRNMVRFGIEVMKAGFTPYIPCWDFIVFLFLREDERITEATIKRLSKDWLEMCDAMLLTPGWSFSAGTLVEYDFAKERGIPVYESLDELINATKE